MNLERHPTTVITYPRWLRGWCALTVGVSFAAVAIGTLVTTFDVGMADKVWPTPPWYLLVTERLPSFGSYVEHLHRLAAFGVGVAVFIQSLAMWSFCPNRARRFVALGSLVVMALGLGLWMRQAHGVERSVSALVNPGLAAIVLGSVVLAVAACTELGFRSAGRWTRAIVTVAAIGVIAQAMFGGIRVFLNELAGQQLRVVHGVFAQVVFSSVCLLAMMAGRSWNSLADLVTDLPLKKLSAATVALVFVQVAFGGLLRHLADPIGQRLHPLLAFAIVALVVFMVARTLLDVEGAGRLRGKAIALLATIGVQVLLGIEAWLRTSDPATRYQTVKVADAMVRSLHVLVGFGVVSTATLFAARAWKSKLI